MPVVVVVVVVVATRRSAGAAGRYSISAVIVAVSVDEGDAGPSVVLSWPLVYTQKRKKFIY